MSRIEKHREERRQRQIRLDSYKALHEADVEFNLVNPPFDPVTGQQKVKEFIANLVAWAEFNEANWERPGDVPFPEHLDHYDTSEAHKELVSYFTLEQKAEVAALEARSELIDLKETAKAYQELLEALDDAALRIELVPDDEDVKLELKSIIVIRDREAATEWFRAALAYGDDDDDDDDDDGEGKA